MIKELVLFIILCGYTYSNHRDHGQLQKEIEAIKNELERERIKKALEQIEQLQDTTLVPQVSVTQR